MRLAATALLLAMAGVFVVALRFEHLHPAWGYVVAFAEAAMVGGLADWFAVTALFRHPLGIPIPHTAIIPENKDRIADTMASFLRSNFLIPQVVARRLRTMNLAESAGRFLSDPTRGGEGRLKQGASSLFADVLASLDQEQLGGLMKSGLKGQLEKLELSPLLGQLLTSAIADKRHLPLLESLLRWTGLTLEANEELLRGMIHQRANTLIRWTGLDEKLANSILDGLYRLLAECIVDPQHPLRGKIEEGLEKLAHDLSHDKAMQAKVARMKQEVLANPAMGRWLDGMWERTRAAMLRAARDPDNALSGQFGASLAELGSALQRDARLQAMVNRFARRTLAGITTRYGDHIVRLVSETVKRWDAQTVTARIEGAVGRDLQFIRINGTLVGGLVGVAIHALIVLI
jgi:uncharacterized membrane-anchored protein YjiN (DUF445 family)